MIRNISCVVCAVAAVSSASAFAFQETIADGARPDLAPALRAWRAEHGDAWRAAIDAETGYAEMLYGGRAAPRGTPRSDADFIVEARDVLNRTAALHGIETTTLAPVRALFLPLDQVGCGDKETVRFRQEIGGVRVLGGFVNVLMSARGELLSIQSTSLPRTETVAPSIATSARLDARRATLFAARAFRGDASIDATQASEPELVIDQVHAAGRRLGRLAWEIDLQWRADGAMPRGITYRIDAATGEVLDKEESVLSLDVTGTVQSMATPGLLPDIAGNSDTPQPMRFLAVTSSAGTAVTDTSGNFVFPGVSAPLACTFTYAGNWSTVTDNGGPAYTLTTTLQPNQANVVTMNPAAQGSITSQANAFRVVDLMRDFVRSINPNDATADFVATANCNLAQTCNAYFDGGAINFFAPGGGCPNTAYSTVISHEHGHWMNSRYGTGNGGDGMGEGNADVWSMYIHDTPIIGDHFFGNSFIRTGNNTQPFCGDDHPSCYGEVHADGEPWMGAAWKVRNRLNVTHGNALGDLIADNIFLGWMNAYNQTQIKSIIEVQWLTLDDDDGNIFDGTPHYADIDGGFRDQSFPGVALPFVTIGPVTDAQSTIDQVGPYVVGATIHGNFNPPITSATLAYRVDNGVFATIPMTLQGGNDFQAAIPGIAAPAHVEYYISATDNAAHSGVYPTGAPAVLVAFDVGVVHVLRSDNFDGTNDNGWTHGALSGADDWQRSIPTGKSGTSGGIAWSDPTADSTHAKCWGSQLGQGASTGAYSASSSNWLRTPPIDCSAASGTRLRFRRWLTVQGSANDQALIKVNGVQVFANPTANLVDALWTNQEIDISSVADHNASVEIEWSLQSDGTTQLGGWNIDDVQVLWIAIPCAPGTHFCVAAANSVGASGATMSYQGSTLVASNDLELITFGAPPEKTCLFFYGQNQISAVPFGNGMRCIGNPFFRLPATQTSIFGDANFDLDLNALPAGGEISAGEVWGFQLWYRDPAAGGANYNSSDGLSLTFCP
jgi:hypothetical protein